MVTTVDVRLTPTEYNKLQNTCDLSGLTKVGLLRSIIEYYAIRIDGSSNQKTQKNKV